MHRVADVLDGMTFLDVALLDEPLLPKPCGAMPFTVAVTDEEVSARATDGIERCDGLAHVCNGACVRRCPSQVVEEIRARRQGEVERLKACISKCRGGATFSNFDVTRHENSKAAYSAMLDFSKARKPRGVVISGSTGVGKTHLLLSSHFARIEAGLPSEFVTTAELRRVFVDAAAFDAEKSSSARAMIDRLENAVAIHLDDLGDQTGTAAFHAGFRTGLKSLLDVGTASWAVSLNLGSQEARRHPDIGDAVLSRLCDDADLILLTGRDQRIRRKQAAQQGESR